MMLAEAVKISLSSKPYTNQSTSLLGLEKSKFLFVMNFPSIEYKKTETKVKTGQGNNTTL